MPEFSPEIYRKAADAIEAMRLAGSVLDRMGPRQRAEAEARAALDAVAADLGNAVAVKILAHMEADGPSVRVKLQGDAALKRHMRRLHFETAARIASHAFLTEEDTLRQVAEALARGDYSACNPPESRSREVR